MARTAHLPRPKHLIFGVCALLALPPTYAEPKQQQDAAIQQVLRKAQGALRQLTEEKAQLEEQKAALEKEKTEWQSKAAKLEEQVKQLEPLQGELEKQKAVVESLKASTARLESDLGGERQKGAALHGKMKQIVAQAKLIQADNLHLVEAVKEREQWIGQCSQKNQSMAETNGELLKLYQDKGFFDKLAEWEPVTGIGKVSAENTVQDYHFKLEDLKTTPFESQLPAREAGQGGQNKAQPAFDDDEEVGD